MDENMFDNDKILPQEWCIKGVDDILYDIGLSLTSFREDHKKRKFFHNPELILVINLIYLTFGLVKFYLKSRNELASFALFDVDYFLGLNHKAKTCQIIMSITLLFTQSVYYYNYRRGIKTSFLRLFQIMTGVITPSSGGLVNEKYLILLTKKLKTILDFNIEKISVLFLT